jgi:serine phosphatase RsbU (regulator of sigma subunit)/anti-sigma regulatory factor (Ser/Thr protein kinase)
VASVPGDDAGADADPTEVRRPSVVEDPEAALVAITSRLNVARTPQAIADAVGDVARTFAGWFGVALGLVNPTEPVLELFWSAPLSDSVRARYLRVPLDIETPQTRAVRISAPVFVPDAATLQSQFPGPFRDAQTEGLGATAALPLTARDGAVTGSLAIMWSSEREFSAEDMAFALEIAELTAETLERVRSAERDRSVALALQNALLALDMWSAHVVVGARYVSSDSDLRVGGDWYDAIERDDGKVVVAVGDVVGSGLDAAATMGRLRSSLGITALQTPDPARILRYLDHYAARVPGAIATTVAIAVHDGRRERVSYVSAGHPPALLARPGGAVDVLEGGRSWPLQIGFSGDRPSAASAAFPAGSVLVLYTDGVVERRGEIIDEGIARLSASLRAHWNLPVRHLVRQLLADVGIDDIAPHDDTAVIALRSVGTDPTLFVDTIPVAASDIALLRHRLQAWLEGLALAAPVVSDIVVAVNEAVTNAVMHGGGFDAAKVVQVEACRRPEAIIVTVSDGGRWLPGLERDPTVGGRGFRIMEQLSSDVTIETGEFGTAVSLQWELAE